MRQLLPLVFLSCLPFFAAAQVRTPSSPIYGPAIDGAHVRFVHASPNAGPARVVLSSTTEGLAERQVVDLEYSSTTAYRTIADGTYEISILLGAEGDEEEVASARLDAVLGGVYTVAVVGLQLDEPVDEGADDGLWVWIRDLFAPDRPEVALRAYVLDDVGRATYGLDAPAYRIVHAAPGTDAVELVHVRDDAVDVLASVSYLDASSFVELAPDAGRLEVRAAGAPATIDVLLGVEQAPGLIHTLFLVGTPIESVPLRTVVATADWVALGPVAPGTMAARGMVGPLTASEVASLRELLVALGHRVEAVQRQLAELTDQGEGPTAEARLDLEQAIGLLERARELLDVAEERAR